MLSDQHDPLDSAAAEPLEKNLTPAADTTQVDPRDIDNTHIAADPDATPEDPADPPRPKRNCGRTGPTSAFGRATSSRNATRHGLCSETLILSYESEAKWLELLACWLSDYQNPADNSLLYTFVVKAAQAEWFRQRAQKEYDFFLRNHNDPPMYAWTRQRIKEHDLLTRYVTAAERRFQRDYRTLEQHWKSHAKFVPQNSKPVAQPDHETESIEDETPEVIIENADTGETLDVHRNYFPPPPDFKPEPIIPGVYRPGELGYEPPTSYKRGRLRR